MKSIKTYRILIISLILCVLSIEVSSAMRYRTDLLERMADGMQMRGQIESLGEGEHYGTLSFRGLPLSVRIHNGEVCHIGHLVFRKELREMEPLPVYDFIERYTLEVRIPYDRTKPVLKQIQEDEIVFTVGSFELLCSLYDVPDIQIDRQNGRYYTVTWSSDGNVLCSMSFRNVFELLNGSQMEENERRLPENVMRHIPSVSPPDSVDRDELISTWMDNCFILPGDSYYTDKMTSNLYYEREGDNEGSFRLLYNRMFPVESIANLFCTAAIANDIVLNIAYRKYGMQTSNFKVSLNKWTDFCIQQGCTPYFGVLNEGVAENDGIIECMVVMKNTDSGYLHLLKAEVPRSIVNDSKREINAVLNSYIPHSRIRNLFDDIAN